MTPTVDDCGERIAPIRVEFDGRVVSGRAVELPDVSPERVRAAVRGETDALAIDCPSPRPVHDHVGYVYPATSIRPKTALAAAARSRGATAPQEDRLDAVRARLDAMPVPAVPDASEERRRLAEADAAVDRLRERVATIRGRVQAGRDIGRDVSDLEDELTAAIRELSERETDRAAARERLVRTRDRAREARTVRERRRRLEEKAENLERDARAALVDAVRDEFAAAVAAAPEGGTAEDPFEADPVTAALAVARVGSLRAPVVLAVDRFRSPEAAADWLGTPVIRVEV